MGHGCGPKQKMRYSKTEAERAAIELAEFEDDPNAPLTAYKCQRCGRWHVGHNRFTRRES